MKKVKGSITSSDDVSQTEDYLFTYSEEEKQQREIDRANAGLVFTPEFIPFYPLIKEQFQLTDTETLLFGFVKFFLSNARKDFYFNNEQLSLLLSVSIPTITRSVATLEARGILKVSRKIKAGGGQIRYLKPTNQILSAGLIKMISKNDQNHRTNKNKINKNKKNTFVNQNDYSGNTTPSLPEENKNPNGLSDIRTLLREKGLKV